MKYTITTIISIIFATVFITGSALAKAPAADMFGKNARIADAALSPDATQIAIIESHKGGWYVRVVDLTGKNTEPRVIGIGEQIIPGWVKWANDTQVLIDVTRSQVYQKLPIQVGLIYTFDSNTMKGKFLVQPKRGTFRQFSNNVVDFLADDPDHILMAFSNANDNNEEPDVKRVNVATGEYKTVSRGRKNVQWWETDLTGDVRVGQGLDENHQDEIRYKMIIKDIESGKWVDSTKYPDLNAGVSIHGFMKNKNEMIVGTRRSGKNTTGLYIYDLAKKSYTRTLYENETYDAAGIVLNADGSDVIGARYTAETSEVEIFDEYATTLDRLRRKHKGFTIDFIDQSADKKTLIYRISNAYDPGYLMMVDARTMEENLLAKYREDLNPNNLGVVVSVKYTARDGAKIPAFVTIPPTLDGKDLKDLPFIVLPHGGPYARTSKRFDTYSQFFATRGYGVLQMNFRGSAGYGEAYENAGRENWVLMLNDVEDGARWLVEKGYTNPDKLCVAGWSFGGYAALMEAIENPDLYSCVLSMAGVTDLKDLINDEKKYRFGGIRSKNSILAGFDNRKELKQYSPAKRASEMKVPTFIAHGKYDQAVHFDQFKRMKRGLKKSSADVTAVEFEKEDHYLSNEKNAVEFYQEMDKFLREHMGESPHIQK
ncbi:MAG: prolyl oligopeptidase family serine peptidase [Maricaulaceae bacterium]